MLSTCLNNFRDGLGLDTCMCIWLDCAFELFLLSIVFPKVSWGSALSYTVHQFLSLKYLPVIKLNCSLYYV